MDEDKAKEIVEIDEEKEESKICSCGSGMEEKDCCGKEGGSCDCQGETCECDKK